MQNAETAESRETAEGRGEMQFFFVELKLCDGNNCDGSAGTRTLMQQPGQFHPVHPVHPLILFCIFILRSQNSSIVLISSIMSPKNNFPGGPLPSHASLRCLHFAFCILIDLNNFSGGQPIFLPDMEHVHSRSPGATNIVIDIARKSSSIVYALAI
jgi:hypothetical protein